MNIDETVAYMINELKSLPEGTELCSGQLIRKMHPRSVYDELWFEIHSKFRSAAWENGFYLNNSLYYKMALGLPFNCTFFLKKKKEEKKFDLLRWRMCSDVDSGMIVEINLHKKTVSYFHTPETVDPDIHQCSEDEWRKIADLINDSKFSQWEEMYGNAAEIDDANWEVELICNGSVVKKSRGFHYFPDEWRIFNILQEQCRSFSDVEYAIPFPDEKMYRFVNTVELDGVLDLPKRWEIFSQISKGKRVKLVREKGSFFKKNIIRVDMPFSDGRKIGSIPENLAALWAPRMNSGTFYTGWINNYSASKKMIAVDVYEKSLLPMKNITNIYFSEGGFYGTDTHYELSFLKKQLTCKKETEYRSGKFRTTVFSFSKEEWQNTVLPALRKCNLFAWHTSYRSPDAFDEPQWQLTLYCKKKKIYFSGNDYPEEWEHWQECLRLCTTLTDVHKETNEE